MSYLQAKRSTHWIWSWAGQFCRQSRWQVDWQVDWQPSNCWRWLSWFVLAGCLMCAPCLGQNQIQDQVQSLGSEKVASLNARDDEPLPLIAKAAQVRAKTFLIGNSLTWDTLPGLLDGDVQWHVDCGKSLQQIHDQPAQPCVKTSIPWSKALTEKQYDYLCVQPFSGTNLTTDVAVISKWLKLQPTAVLVLHTGWSRADDFEKECHAPLNGQQLMLPSTAYFEKLRAELLVKFPDREIRTTQAIAVLDVIWHDVEQDAAPFAAFKDLYRDDIHMTTQVGRYLIHNVMRRALGQAPSSQGFQIESAEREYLDAKLNALPAVAHDAMP